jgi:hypothetical protein
MSADFRGLPQMKVIVTLRFQGSATVLINFARTTLYFNGRTQCEQMNAMISSIRPRSGSGVPQCGHVIRAPVVGAAKIW